MSSVEEEGRILMYDLHQDVVCLPSSSDFYPKACVSHLAMLVKAGNSICCVCKNDPFGYAIAPRVVAEKISKKVGIGEMC